MGKPIDCETQNSFRRPDWRLERVLQLVDRPEGPARSSRRDDHYVRTLRNFILRYRVVDDAQRNQLGYENPGLYWAYQIHDRRMEECRRTATLLECRILAGQSDEEIAEEWGTLPDTVAWYESLFFNVRDRLKNPDWILDQVLMPAIQLGRETASFNSLKHKNAGADRDSLRAPLSEPFFDPTLRFFAFYGGKFALDLALTGFRRGVQALSQDDVGAWFDDYVVHRLKQRSGLAAESFEVNKYNVVELFAVHAQIMAIEKSAEPEAVKNDNIHRAISAMLGEMPWALSGGAQTRGDGTPLQRDDGSGVQRRDNEAQALAAGLKVASTTGIETMEMPPPRDDAGPCDALEGDG